MATKKTTPTITNRQIYEKVCSVEKMLKDCLEVPSSPVQSTENPPHLAVAGPEMPLSVIRLEDAPDYLPCFDEADLLYGFQDRPIMMSYDPVQVMEIGEESYLTGPMVFFRVGPGGSTVSLQVEDLYYLTEFLESHSVILMTGKDSLVSVRLD